MTEINADCEVALQHLHSLVVVSIISAGWDKWMYLVHLAESATLDKTALIEINDWDFKLGCKISKF